MAYFGFQLMEAGENEYPDLSEEDRQRHLNYFSKTYRMMGIPFSTDRGIMEKFARSVETSHAGQSQHLTMHARNILALGEMVGVPSHAETITDRLPEATRTVFAPLHSGVRPGPAKRLLLKTAGRLLVRKAIGHPGRRAVPFTQP